MPEEHNRVLTDPLSDLLLVPSRTAEQNLKREHPRGRIMYVGDVMVDVADLFRPRARENVAALERAGVRPASSSSPPRTAPRTSTIPRACGARRRCCSPCRTPWSCRCTRARGRA